MKEKIIEIIECIGGIVGLFLGVLLRILVEAIPVLVGLFLWHRFFAPS